MAIVSSLVLLCLFLFAPLNLFASERVSDDRTIPGSAGETQSNLSQEKELPPTYGEKESAVGAQYVSSPVATKAVDRNISLFTEKIKERFSLYLQRSGKYLTLMKEILKAKNIPEDIAFLPLIESGFNPNAYSVARAVGPWQFIASTARNYGLTIDWWRDERKDPVKSTEAAANYLKDLYEMFGSWNLAMAAYNAGEGKILRALNRTKSDNYWALLNTRLIRKETKEYVPRFIAATLIATNPHEYGFADVNYHPPLQYDEVVLDRPVDLDIAAQCAETSLDMIRELNPEIRRWSTPANVSSYALRIPYGKTETFTANLSRIPEEERFSVSTYTVKKGDTLKNISTKTGIPVIVIMELNDDGNGLKTLKAGKTISLPPKEKLCFDRDDREGKKSAKNRGSKGKKKANKKIVVTSLSKKQPYVND
ncbi:MAG TPA: transglycosylase SLT domain-containing protein [Thermodesulfovibrionales bacterium]|nr:transglycosylase SLT domain-containing protein [Thermodesulfovibrionales bacterium]